MDYYLILDGTVYGPYTLSEMKSLQLFPDTPVHLSSWPDDKWVYASDLAELRDYTPDLHAARSSSSSVTNIIHIVQPQSQPQPQPQPDITFPENNDEPCVEREPEKSYNTVIFPVIFLVIAAVAVIIAVGVGNSGSGGYDAGDVKSKDSNTYKESGTRPVVTNVPRQNGNKYNAKASSSDSRSSKNTYNIAGKGNTPYTYKMSCKRELFENNIVGKIDLPNGDVIDYQYRIGDDSYLHYGRGSCSYIRFTMADKGSILQKYSISARQLLDGDRVDESWLWAASGTPRDEIVNPDGSVWGAVKPQDLPVFCQHQIKEVVSDYILVYISKR